MKLLIFGASGLIGTELSQKLSKDHETYLALRKSNDHTSNTRIVEFEKEQILAPERFDGVYCCLGTTIKKSGSEDKFRRVDLDYVVKSFEYAKQSKASFFCVVSALGANKDSSIFYNRVKGEMESCLADKNLKVIIIRPSLLIGDRLEFRPGEYLGIKLIGPLRHLFPKSLKKYAPVKASIVAETMIELTLTGNTSNPLEYIIK